MTAMQPEKITTDRIPASLFSNKAIALSVLRLDKIHPLISGNKWFKLRYYLEEAHALKKKHVVTFGGAWSNHIVAAAAACRMEGLACTGIIRGETPESFSPTLVQARELGMELYFISRQDYRDKKIPELFRGEDYYRIPEGGYGSNGVKGAATIAALIDPGTHTHICCAAGTGTMLAGLQTAASNPVTGISVLKNHSRLEEEVKALLPAGTKQPVILHDYHFGGYAKYTPELTEFMNRFYRQTGIPSDFVYTGKLFFAVNDLIQKNFFPAGSNVLLVHSGGLQGNASLSKDTLIF